MSRKSVQRTLCDRIEDRHPRSRARSERIRQRPAPGEVQSFAAYVETLRLALLRVERRSISAVG